MKQPFAYMRKSSVRDLSKDIAPETQEREVRALAARHGDRDVTLLADWDISGRAKFTKKRASYLQLVEAVESGQVSAVYSYSLSRLGRSVAELARFFDLCHAKGVPVRLVVDSVDTSTASGRLLANVLGSVAQFEADVAGERLRAMYDTKRARGEDLRTSKRYGEAEGEDGQVVLDAFRETGSYSRAARLLNERGIKPRSSEHWWASSVGVVVERLDPEIAAKPTERAPNQRASTHPKGGTNFTLARLLRCPLDGAMLTGGRIPLPKGGTVTRYACRHAESMPHQRVSIAEHLILPAIEAEAARYSDPDERIEPGERGARRLDRRAELELRRQRVVESRLDGLIDRGEAARQVAVIDAEMATFDAKPKRQKMVGQMTPREVNAILRSLFKRIDIDPATFQPVHFEWQNPAWREESYAERLARTGQ